jgi:hypothetical protein
MSDLRVSVADAWRMPCFEGGAMQDSMTHHAVL